MLMIDKKFVIEIVVKNFILFTCIAFITDRMEDYITYEYSPTHFTCFLIGTNIIGIIFQHFYFIKRFRQNIKYNFFKKHRQECLDDYQLAKRQMFGDNSQFHINPFPLIKAIGTHEHLLESYTDRSLEAEFIVIKRDLLAALAKQDNDNLLMEIGRMKNLLSRFEFVYRK